MPTRSESRKVLPRSAPAHIPDYVKYKFYAVSLYKSPGMSEKIWFYRYDGWLSFIILYRSFLLQNCEEFVRIYFRTPCY